MMGVAAALTPRVRTMVICDRVRESSKEAGVFHLKGVRQSIVASEFPYSPRHLWLFIHLSSPRSGRFPGYVRVVNDQDDKTIFYAHVNPEPIFDEGRGKMAVFTQLRLFSEPGSYTVQVWFFQEIDADVLKGELPFELLQAEV